MIKVIYQTMIFCFLCIFSAQATTLERETLWKEIIEVRNTGNSGDIKKVLEMLLEFEKKDLSRYPDIHCHALILKAHTYRNMDQIDSANQTLNHAEILIKDYALDSLKANVYRQLGLNYWKNLDFESSIPIFKKGLRFDKNNANGREGMLLAYNISAAYRYTYNQDSARFYIHKVLNHPYIENDSIYITRSLKILGSIEKNDGNLLKAIEYYFEAYRVAKMVLGDNDATKNNYFVSHIYDIYYELGNLSASLDNINIMIDHKKATGKLSNIEAILLTKSSLLLRMDSIESSALTLAEVEQSHQVSKNPKYHNQVTALKGGILFKKKLWGTAEKELSKLIPEVDSASLKSPIDKIALLGLSQLAQLLLQKGGYTKSISICEQRLKNKGIGYHYKIEFLGTLAECHRALGNHRTAYNFLKQRGAIRDTIDHFYAGTIRLSKEQEMLDQQKVNEIEKLKYQNELSQVKSVQQRNLLIVGGVLSLLIFGILYLWGRQRKLVIESELVDVKQRLLRQQINPHFIFNVLNSIQNSVLTLKKEKSIELISKFSKLIRQILQNSDKMKVSIDEELSLLTNYMDLEKVRTRNKFDYEVSINEGIDIHNDEIPSMILQLFVENAIWHGILPNEERGLIKVIVEKKEDRIKVIIDDNGVGRKMSAKLKTRDQKEKVSMGMYLVRQRIQTLNKRYQTNIDMFIDDGRSGKGTQALLIA